MPTISIVIPVYNTQEYIGKCFDSLLNQTYSDFEMILVNDGSTDNSEQVCLSYVEKDTRIKLINKENGGLADTRNTGMASATGKYISFIDGDDYLEPDYLEKCISKLEETDADMVIFDVNQLHVSTGYTEVLTNPYDENNTYTLKENPEMITKILNAAWNKVYKLSLFKDNNIEYPKGFQYEDLGTTYRLLAKANKIAFVNKPLYNYLVDRPENLTSKFDKRTYNVMDMMDININFYKQLGIYDEMKEELKYLGCVNILECLKKTRNSSDKQLCDDFIDASFKYIYEHWPDFPKCKYQILREKNDWIYANPTRLKLYLSYRRLMGKGVW